MRGVLAIDIEPDERTPTPTDDPLWSGAEALLADCAWLRGRLASPVLNWFVRIDHQVEVLHGADDWAAGHYAERLGTLADAGDEVGVHPHNWRLEGDTWRPVGTDSWCVENAERSLAGYRSVFGHTPASFRFGDRFVSDAVVSMLLRHPEVLVDLTTEPGVSAARGLVPGERAIGINRHIDPLLGRRHHPSSDTVDIAGCAGTLTMVPLTTGLVPGTGTIDTLQLWRQPAEFAEMLRFRLLDDGLDHLEFAIRSDAAVIPWAVDHIEQNLDEVRRVLPLLEWVRASELALATDDPGAGALGPTGALGRRVAQLEREVEETRVERSHLRNELACLDASQRTTAIELDRERERVAVAEGESAALVTELRLIQSTLSWRMRERMLPVLRPIVRCVRSFRRAGVNSDQR